MLFVMTLKWQPGLTREQRDGALIRRSQWNYPEGVKVIGEFWPSSESLAVVSAFETDDQAALMDIGFTWGDVQTVNNQFGTHVIGRRPGQRPLRMFVPDRAQVDVALTARQVRDVRRPDGIE